MLREAKRKIYGVESESQETEFMPYLDAFKFDCQIRNLTEKTIAVYFERLTILFRHLQYQGIPFGEVTKQTLQEYVMSVRGKVSDETVRGRLRAFRRFWNFLEEDGLWESDNPTKGIKLLNTAQRIRPVVDPAKTNERPPESRTARMPRKPEVSSLPR